ncbi:MAG: hypothetical protein IAF08_12315 [Rhizobacter sp.]|nr:hypothetical protein [Chlorobiales bacterium]
MSSVINAGDIVSFVCRDGSFGMAKVLKIDTSEALPVPQAVYHLLVYSYRNLFPPTAAHAAEAKPFIGHLPVMQSGIDQSDGVVITSAKVSGAELEGYDVWREAFFAGEAGIFELPIDEAIAIVLEALGKSSP